MDGIQGRDSSSPVLLVLDALGGEIFERICVSGRRDADVIVEEHRISGFQESLGTPVTPDSAKDQSVRTG
jgi:hypothetical protein